MSSTKLTRADIERVLEAGGVPDLHEQDLSRVDLSNLNLSGVNLRGANLYMANLRGVNLRGADLRQTGLSDETNQAVLSWANLAELELHKCSFAARDMTGVNLREAYLNRVNLSANKLPKADLRGADLTRCSLQGCDLRGANLQGATLENCDLRQANFQGTNLTDCNAEYSDFRGSNLSGANLSGADLTGCKFQRANLQEAFLLNCQFTEAVYSVKTLWPAQFDPASQGLTLLQEKAWRYYVDEDDAADDQELYYDMALEDLEFWPVNSARIVEPEIIFAIDRTQDRCLAFSFDSRLLTSWGGLNHPAFWDVTAGKLTGKTVEINSEELLPAYFQKALAGQPGRQTGVTALSRSKLRLAFPVESRTGYSAYSVVILTQTGKTASVFELPGYLPSKISALAFSNDEKLLASGSCDGLITVWEVDSGSELYSFQSFAGIVRSLAFSSGNRSLISGSEGGFRYEAMLEDTAYENNEAAGIAYVWSLVTGEFITGLVSRGAPVRAIQFSPDGRVVAGITGSSVVLWKVDWE
ncbi:MAG TPA: pentapeptide repeat-containing protein [Chloroflexia bacterium]|nr:pentapeptide repeat-containing protein [Chloroflexia bacterium]